MMEEGLTRRVIRSNNVSKAVLVALFFMAIGGYLVTKIDFNLGFQEQWELFALCGFFIVYVPIMIGFLLYRRISNPSTKIL